MEIARRLAVQLGVPLHPPGPELPESGAPSWIELQGPSPERQWTATWTTVAWREDGTKVHEAGEGRLMARTGRLALTTAHSQYFSQVVRPFLYTLGLKELGRPSTTYHRRDYPDAAPPVETLRAQALDGRPLSAILLGLEAPTLTPLDRMIALEHAFKLDSEHLSLLVSAFAAGAIEGAEVDAALAARLEGTRPQWSLPSALRNAHSAGASIGPVLRRAQLGTMYLLVGVREAFGLSLRSAMMVVDAASGKRDAELDEMLAEILAAGTDERSVT